MLHNMEAEEQVENEDVIDTALDELVSFYVENEDDEQEFIDVADDVMNVISDLIDEAVIDEIPEVEAEEQTKKDWLEKSIPLIKEKLEEDSEEV